MNYKACSFKVSKQSDFLNNALKSREKNFRCAVCYIILATFSVLTPSKLKIKHCQH